MHTCIIFTRAFTLLLMITAGHQLDCLFGSKHKWYALIPYSFIVELGIVSMNAGEMGPITVSDGSLWLHCRARLWRSQTGRKREIKGHLFAFVNLRSKMEKHFSLWAATVRSGLQIRLARTHLSALPRFLITRDLPVSFTDPPHYFLKRFIVLSSSTYCFKNLLNTRVFVDPRLTSCTFFFWMWLNCHRPSS